MDPITWSLANIINSLGLSLDIIGVALLFRYGLPPENVSRTGAQLLAWGTDVDDQDLYTIVITTYIPPRQVGDGPWTPWYADYYHPEV